MGDDEKTWEEEERQARIAESRPCARCEQLKRVDELHMRHIDGDPLNNHPANIALMCGDCLEQSTDET